MSVTFTRASRFASFVVAGFFICFAGSSTALAITVSDSNFDQVERVNQLDGAVSQIGGGQPGKILQTSADFVGPVNNNSGVLVSLPDFLYTEAEDDFDRGASTEPGNHPELMLGVPTDITFTRPGNGGPDGTDGDGSVHMTVPGGAVTLWFDTSILAPPRITHDLFVFTDTAGGGTATFDLLDDGGNVLSSTGSVTAPGGATASGMGGLLLDVPDGTTYAGLRVTLNSGAAEVDAVAAYALQPAIPEPAAGAMALLLLAAWQVRRRRV